ncbi:type II toxin-antitoxin system RelE/ParE family toxin [Rahnella woolbedingensis]|uniref:Diaminopimelate decarboxylase n=1 Tax=Rahnella woolbedingensis TaxID=1510574 RepID=A0A419N7L0_9GAMM|nr:type II toxin-antitoxin system RelE/ParE family toxin [Rahnella woolbedingensis]RJT43205.1 diaminopimelate decarboxylase [Rahnella woolbedingensis]
MWIINTTERFDGWFVGLEDVEQASVLALVIVLKDKGPALSRAYADTVNYSCHRNMKELRIQSKGDPIRAFFAFDPLRRGILLCAGNKVGNEKRFYEVMIPVADSEFTRYLNTLKEEELP